MRPVRMIARGSAALAFAASAGLSLIGCGSSEGVATAKPISHEKSIEAIQNNPNMPEAAKQQALARMKAADSQAGFMPTKR